MLCNCEDPTPDDYLEMTLIEALLIVDEPIKQIHLTKTLPLNKPYYYGDALIKDAIIFIYEGNNEMKLTYKQYDSANIKKSGYYYKDTTYKVKPNTEYELKAILNDGNEITGTTKTPNRIEWVKKIDYIIPYPDDTLNLPPYIGGQTEWTNGDKGTKFYQYSVICLDTLGYGKYLVPKTTEFNRRIRISNNPNRDSLRPSEVVINSYSYINKMPFNWNFCRWFGLHRLKIYASDKNYEQWYAYYFMSPNFSHKSYSVVGAAGYFGSAATIEADFFLKKNKYAIEK
jgi:hypothetical protein